MNRSSTDVGCFFIFLPEPHSPIEGPQWVIISFIYFIYFYLLLWLHLPNTILLLWIIRYLSVLCICVSIYYLGALRVYNLYVIVNYICNLHICRCQIVNYTCSSRTCICLSRVWLFATPWTVACQAPLGFFQAWILVCGLLFPAPGDLPDPGIEPVSPTLQADALPVNSSISPLIMLV